MTSSLLHSLALIISPKSLGGDEIIDLQECGGASGGEGKDLCNKGGQCRNTEERGNRRLSGTDSEKVKY